MKKTILIIGANAALAQEVMPVLAKGSVLITAGKKDCDIYCDITGPITIPDNVDVVINFAASFGGTDDEEIATALRTNVLGALEVCKAAKAAGVGQVVLISSVFALLDETSASYSIYAITKRHADELAQFYCKLNQIPLTIIRPSRIYGDSTQFEKNQPFFYQIIQKAQQGEDISIYGTHDASRNYIHSADVAEVIARVVAQCTEGIYTCAYPSDSTYAGIARTAQRVFNRGGHVRFIADKPDIPDDAFPLEQSIYEKIDYWPHISMEVGIERIKRYREGETE